MVGQPVQHEGTIPDLPHKLRVPNIVEPNVVRRNDQRLGDAERAHAACGKQGAFWVLEFWGFRVSGWSKW